MYDVITIGSATRDVFLKSEGVEIRKHADSPTGVEQCFPLGTKIEVKEVVFTTGGGGTNTAVTFARQGLKTGSVGVIGNDFNGKEVIKELKREKIKPFFVVHKDDFTAYSVILVYPVKSAEGGAAEQQFNGVNPAAERTILSYKGEGQHFEVDRIAWKKLKARWFYLDSLGGRWDLLEKAFEYAAARNFRIAFNPGGKELSHGLEKLKPYLAEVDIFITNKEEGESLLEMANNNEPKKVLTELDKLTKGITVLTLGPEGVIVSDKKNIYRAGVPDSPRVERTGAGDAFGSGFVAQYILLTKDQGLMTKAEDVITKSIQFATANASSVVAQVGPKAGILRKDNFGPWPLVQVSVSSH